MSEMYKPRVLVDFDGVIHQYSRGWADGSAYDDPMPGAREALDAMEAAGYEVVIFSTRDAQQVEEWMEQHDFRVRFVTREKMPAVALIDDRAIRFAEWSTALADLQRLYPVVTR